MSKIKDALRMAELAVEGIETIQHLTGVGGVPAEAALKVIDSIVRSLHDGFDGKSTPDIVASEINALRKSLASNDEAADEALRKRFDTSEGGEG